jgi:large subunit ribosomal protein L18
MMALSKQESRLRIRKRIRQKVTGTKEKPRMSVFRSNKQIYVQLIDDHSGTTLAAASSRDKKIAAKTGITKSEQAKLVGELIAEISLAKGIKTVVFDRGGYMYHGRVKQLAEGAREGGLKF